MYNIQIFFQCCVLLPFLFPFLQPDVEEELKEKDEESMIDVENGVEKHVRLKHGYNFNTVTCRISSYLQQLFNSTIRYSMYRLK